MQRIVKRITAIIVALTIALLNIPNIEVFGEAIGDITISISVVDTENEPVNDAIVKINGVVVNTQQSNNIYTLSFSGYDTENLSITVYSSDEATSKSVSYTEGVSDYTVTLPKKLSIGNNKAYYDKVQCDNAKVNTEGMIDSAKIKYTSPGIVRVRCCSINNSQIYEDVVIELHITNELSFKYSENRDINPIYSVSEKSDSGEVDTVTIKGRDIGSNTCIDVTY